jgi:hypothetical protein
MLTYIGTYGQLLGFGDSAPYLLIIQNGSSLIGRIGAGILADRIGVYNTVFGGCSIITIMFWVWLACTTVPACIVLVVIIGISSGAFISLQGPMAMMTAQDMRFGGTLVGQALCECHLWDWTHGSRAIICAAHLRSDFWCCPWVWQFGGSSRQVLARNHPRCGHGLVSCRNDSRCAMEKGRVALLRENMTMMPGGLGVLVCG